MKGSITVAAVSNSCYVAWYGRKSYFIGVENARVSKRRRRWQLQRMARALSSG